MCVCDWDSSQFHVLWCGRFVWAFWEERLCFLIMRIVLGLQHEHEVIQLRVLSLQALFHARKSFHCQAYYRSNIHTVAETLCVILTSSSPFLTACLLMLERRKRVSVQGTLLCSYVQYVHNLCAHIHIIMNNWHVLVCAPHTWEYVQWPYLQVQLLPGAS